MGKKQKEKVEAVQQVNQQTSKHRDTLIAEIDKMTKIVQKGEKPTDFKAVLIARMKLNDLMPEYKFAIQELETFVEKKKKRWIGKSTLPQAEDFLKKAKQDYDLTEELINKSMVFSGFLSRGA